jgi:hypothetical protein
MIKKSTQASTKLHIEGIIISVDVFLVSKVEQLKGTQFKKIKIHSIFSIEKRKRINYRK